MGRIAARIFAVICVGGGIGLLAWGISGAVMNEPLPDQVAAWGLLGSTSAIIGWGAGILAVGLTTLFLTFADRGPYEHWEE